MSRATHEEDGVGRASGATTQGQPPEYIGYSAVTEATQAETRASRTRKSTILSPATTRTPRTHSPAKTRLLPIYTVSANLTPIYTSAGGRVVHTLSRLQIHPRESREFDSTIHRQIKSCIRVTIPLRTRSLRFEKGSSELAPPPFITAFPADRHASNQKALQNWPSRPFITALARRRKVWYKKASRGFQFYQPGE